MDQEQELQSSLLDWWFADARESVPIAKSRGKFWYSPEPAADAEIRERFGNLVTRACAGELAHWQESAHGCLALVLLTDQFTRNIYRRQVKAFSGDDIAVFAADHAIENRFDRQLVVLERSFLYHPYMHSEDPKHQARSVELFTRLIFESPSAWTSLINVSLDFALEHRNLIERFGRFPHRNEVLRRKSTSEELEFLKDASRYGQ